MRRLALPLALVLGLLVSGAASAASRTAFTGEWIGSDPTPPTGDGSTVHLYVTGGTQAKVTFIDEHGTVCISSGASNPLFTATLTGTVIEDDFLLVTFRSARCGSVPLLFLTGSRGPEGAYELDDQGNNDPSDDTLDDGLVIWSRV